jgi:hypothetical protein
VFKNRCYAINISKKQSNIMAKGHDEKGRFTSENTYGGDQGGAGRPEIYTEEWLEKELINLKEWMLKEKNIYYKRYFAERDLDVDIIRDSVKRHPRLARSLKLINDLQECKWVEGSAQKKLDAGISKLMLHKMGAIDTTTTVIVKKESDPVSIAIDEAMGKSKNLVSNE